jgi:LmbE family N-acetylglucosaminyl deacetylase
MQKSKESEIKTVYPEIRRVLAVGAHPDDIDFGASGTVAKFVKDGAQVYYVICTDGSRGSDDPKMTYEKLAKTRESEQRAAAKALGVKEVFFLNREDTKLVADFELKQDIARIIRKIKPDLIITIDPTFYYSEQGFINHTDHRAAGLATMDAFFPMARDRMTFPKLIEEGLEPHVTGEIWFVNWAGGNKKVDVTDTMDAKLAAIKCHTSQFKNFADIEKMMKSRGEGKGRNKKYFERFNAVKLGW